MKEDLKHRILSSEKRILQIAYDCQKSVHLGGRCLLLMFLVCCI